MVNTLIEWNVSIRQVEKKTQKYEKFPAELFCKRYNESFCAKTAQKLFRPKAQNFYIDFDILNCWRLKLLCGRQKLLRAFSTVEKIRNTILHGENLRKSKPNTMATHYILNIDSASNPKRFETR